MSLSRTVYEINGDFSRKSQIFPPRVFCAPCWGVHALEVRVMGLPGRESSLTISSAVWIQARTSQTDTGRQQRPRLRIAWRGKNGERWNSAVLGRDSWLTPRYTPPPPPTCDHVITSNLVVLRQRVYALKEKNRKHYGTLRPRLFGVGLRGGADHLKTSPLSPHVCYCVKFGTSTPAQGVHA